jgi:hypothetical protein
MLAQPVQNVLLVAVPLVLFVLVGLVWWWRSRRDSEAQQLERLFREIAVKQLTGVVVPDGDGGEIHLDQVLLTLRGIVVVHIKRVRGAVFGSDRMDDWTVIDGERRHTFPNPQGPLYDRVAAVKRISREVPVEGAILFTPGATFTGGVPRHVATLAEFRERYGSANGPGEDLEDYLPAWQKLCDAVIDANLDRLKRL